MLWLELLDFFQCKDVYRSKMKDLCARLKKQQQDFACQELELKAQNEKVWKHLSHKFVVEISDLSTFQLLQRFQLFKLFQLFNFFFTFPTFTTCNFQLEHLVQRFRISSANFPWVVTVNQWLLSTCSTFYYFQLSYLGIYLVISIFLAVSAYHFFVCFICGLFRVPFSSFHLLLLPA